MIQMHLSQSNISNIKDVWSLSFLTNKLCSAFLLKQEKEKNVNVIDNLNVHLLDDFWKIKLDKCNASRR